MRVCPEHRWMDRDRAVFGAPRMNAERPRRLMWYRGTQGAGQELCQCVARVRKQLEDFGEPVSCPRLSSREHTGEPSQRARPWLVAFRTFAVRTLNPAATCCSMMGRRLQSAGWRPPELIDGGRHADGTPRIPRDPRGSEKPQHAAILRGVAGQPHASLHLAGPTGAVW